MAKTKRASPAVNKNLPNGPSPEDVLSALAMEILDQEAALAIRERRKAHRKEYELKGITLPESVAAHRHTGKMQGLQGKPAEAPDGLVGEPLQEFLAGWQEGYEARAGAEQTLADVLAAALDNAEKGIVTDGTGGKRLTKKELKAREVALRASSDFTEDEAERARAAGLEMAKGADFGPTDAETVFN